MSESENNNEFDTIDRSKVCYGLFLGHIGPAISFGLQISDEDVKNQLTFSIEESGGRIEKDLNVLKSNTVILTDKESYKEGLYDRVVFKYSYVFDCISKMELLPLGKYSFCPLVLNEDFFDVIYYQTKDFENLESPTVTMNMPINELINEDRYEKLDIITKQKKCINSLDDDDEDGFLPNQNLKAPISNYNKENRQPYSRREKEAILKYIIRNGKLVGLRGNPIWKKMEKAQVCPNRTWQSLKNHFLRSLVPELDRYSFLTHDVKEFMRGNSG